MFLLKFISDVALQAEVKIESDVTCSPRASRSGVLLGALSTSSGVLFMPFLASSFVLFGAFSLLSSSGVLLGALSLLFIWCVVWCLFFSPLRPAYCLVPFLFIRRIARRSFSYLHPEYCLVPLRFSSSGVLLGALFLIYFIRRIVWSLCSSLNPASCLVPLVEMFHLDRRMRHFFKTGVLLTCVLGEVCFRRGAASRSEDRK